MKILYICLNFEDFSTHPNRYGGGNCFAPWAREKYHDFHIAASADCFSGCSKDEKLQNNIVLSQESLDLIAKGDNLEKYIKDLNTYDLIVHHHLGHWINTSNFKIPHAVWSVGYMEKAHKDNRNLLFFNYDLQKPIFEDKVTHNVFHIQMGRPIPEFQEYEREDFLLSITNCCPAFRTNQVVDFCNKHKIKAYFGGPIAEHYDLLNHIDNKNTFYLGVVDYKTKIDYLKRARAFVVMNAYPAPFSLSGLEANSYGCPLISLPVGFFPSYITNGRNGFLIDDEQGFLCAIELSKNIKQLDCWTASKKYDIDSMLQSFNDVFKLIVYS